MMKRIVALFLSILLIMGSMVTPVFAAGADGSIAVSPANPHPGDTITATLSVSGLGEITDLAVQINTPDELTLVKAEWLLDGPLKDFVGGYGVLAFSEPEWLNDTRNLLTVTYQVSKEITSAECVLQMTLRYTNASNEEGSMSRSKTINITESCNHPEADRELQGAKEATCKEEGNTGDIYCRKCETTLQAGTTIPKKGHAPAAQWSSDANTHWKVCQNGCGVKQAEENHMWEWIVDSEATEDAAGEKHEECVDCGRKRNEGTEISKLDHKHTGVAHHTAKAATCKTTGTKEYWTCSSAKCSGKYYSDEACQILLNDITVAVDPGNHTGKTEVRNQKTPTCGEKGYTGDTYCLDCENLIKKGQDEPATGKHNAGDEWKTDSTNHWHVCSECKQEVDKAAHKFDKEVIDKTPTETETGLKHLECECGQVGEKNIPVDKLEHTHTGIVKHDAVTATCTAGGNVTYWTCSGDLCEGKFYGDKNCTNELPSIETPVDEDNHTGGTTVKNKKEATCTEKGYTGDVYCNSCENLIEEGQESKEKGHTGGTATCKDKAVCTRCQESYGDLDPNNHTGGTEIKDQKQETCGAAGYTGDTWCKGCNTMTQKGKEIAATGKHTAGTEWKTDSTDHWHICSVCSAQVDKAAHSFQWTTDKEPTEDTNGLKHEECHICHLKRNEDTVIEKLEHKHTGITRYAAAAATCTKEGNVEYWTCSSDKCSGKYYGDANCTTVLTTVKTSVNAANHTGGTEVKNKKDATCYAAGYTGDNCCVSCGAVITVGETIPATGKHNASSDWRYDNTNHWHICTNSGCSQKVDVEAHSYVWKVDKAATEDNVGTKHEECVCGSKRNEGTEIPKLDHKHTGITHHKADPATCVEAGTVEYWTCSHTKCTGKYYGDADCQILLKTITDPVNKKNHAGGTELKNKKAATCGEAGYTGDIYCTGCGTVREQGEMIPATGKHTPKTGYQKDADCHWQNCAVCNAVIGGAKEEHTYTWIIDENASETAVGKKHQECSVCGHKSKENTVIEKLPHDLKFVAARSCTCTEEGVVEHFHCEGCGKYYLSENGKVGKETTAQSVLVPATGHTGDGTWHSDATTHWHNCGCGERYDEAEHKTECIGAVEPTETEEGFSGDTVCQICGMVVAEGEILPVVIPETTAAAEPETEATEEETTEPETAEPEEQKEAKVNPVAIVAAVAVAAAGIAGGAVIFLRKRKF